MKSERGLRSFFQKLRQSGKPFNWVDGRVSLRFTVFFVVLVIALSLILGQTIRIQWTGDHWGNIQMTRGDGNLMTVQAPRGDIVDSEGCVLAYSQPVDSLYLAYTGLEARPLNQLLLELYQLLKSNGVEPESPLRNFFDRSQLSTERGQSVRYVFKKELEEISRWQQNEDLFNLKLPRGQAKDTKGLVQLDPQKFYEYLLYDAYQVEERATKGNQFYTEDEAWAIIQLRYQLMINNWTFKQGEPVLIAREVPQSLISVIQEQSIRYRGALIKQEYQRKYTDESRYFSHLIGYVGGITKEEYDQLSGYGYQLNEQLGKAGVEAIAERYLHGTSGTAPYGALVSDEAGKVAYQEGSGGRAPDAGATVHLASNLAVQKALYASLFETCQYVRDKDLGDGRSAAAVMIDAQNGQVLGMGSIPSFTPQDFLKLGYDSESNDRVEKALTDVEHKPMQNRCISEIYAPGSTFKPVVSAAAIMSGVIDPSSNRYECKGRETIGYRTWTCFSEPIHGHGLISLQEALMYSCNIYFYKLGLDTGIQNLDHWFNQLGFGRYTGIDLPGEARGIMPSPELKAATRVLAQDKEWYPADTCQTSIGQFDNAYTLIQLVRAIGAIGTNQLVTPHVIREITSDEGRIIRPETVQNKPAGLSDTCIQMVREGMASLKTYLKANHTHENFTGYPVEVCCKTGTAEIGENGEIPNALFVAYAPAENPQIAVACIVEGGGRGDVTANIAKDLMDAWYGYPQRPELLRRMEDMEAHPERYFRNDVDLLPSYEKKKEESSVTPEDKKETEKPAPSEYTP